MYLKTAVASCLLSVSVSSFAYTQNYVEYGLGATQIHSLNSGENKDLTNFSIGGAAKILVAGRMSYSGNTWFELAYTHTNGMSHQDNKLSNQFLAAGLKFTTKPNQGLSSFLKLGGGRTISTSQVVGEEDETNYGNHFYLGAGLSFRMNNKQAINVEIQRFGQKGEDTGINSLFVSFNQSI